METWAGTKEIVYLLLLLLAFSTMNVFRSVIFFNITFRCIKNDCFSAIYYSMVKPATHYPVLLCAAENGMIRVLLLLLVDHS